MNKTFLSYICAFILGITFLLAAFSKINNLVAFHDTVWNFNFLPVWIKVISTLIIPGLELTLGICFLCRFYVGETAIISGLLLFFFLSLELYINIEGQLLGCGCFHIRVPVWMQFSGWWVMARDIFLFYLSLIVLSHSYKNANSIPESPTKP